MWRIVRFLRIIGDARINSGKQGLVEFIEWASKKTGLSKSMVYHQLFPAHQGNGPGYASTYNSRREHTGDPEQGCEEREETTGFQHVRVLDGLSSTDDIRRPPPSLRNKMIELARS